jgi:hypothetical protein
MLNVEYVVGKTTINIVLTLDIPNIDINGEETGGIGKYRMITKLSEHPGDYRLVLISLYQLNEKPLFGKYFHYFVGRNDRNGEYFDQDKCLQFAVKSLYPHFPDAE